MTYPAMHKRLNNGLGMVDAIYCTSARICKEISPISKQFLRHSQVEVLESKRVVWGSYQVAVIGGETATKVQVVIALCTARKTLCI
jgi:hypothetical protein